MLISFSPDVICNRMLFAPVISFELSNGEFSASSIAHIARFSPSAVPDPIIATPELYITVSTSAKSTLTYPWTVMISAIPFAAIVNILSAFENASESFRSPWISLSFSLLITRSESTRSFSSLIPSMAWLILCCPSNRKGIVTIATVRIPASLVASAITGAAPVPVPPPIPAVKKTILVLLEMASIMSSRFSTAACLPISGLLPAPLPSVIASPICIFNGTGLLFRAWASVLQTTKFTSFIPC